MTPVMLFLGLIAVGVGTAMLSQATMGVGVIAIGCFLGICARIVQAGGQHKALLAALGGEAIDATRPRHPTVAQDDGRIACPSCGYRNTAARTTCHQCGAPLPDRNLAPAPVAVPSSMAD